jgi:glutamate synthase (NADPH/NADH) small chain
MITATEETPVHTKYDWAEIARANPPKRSASERVHDYREISELFDEQTVREQACRCLFCPEPLCVEGCPLHNRIPEWIALAAEGAFSEAAAISQSTSNMPEICSRVCPQERLCEGACILNARCEPVTIGAIEKFINEYAFKHADLKISLPPLNGFTAAIVGSGPAGLACADELAKLGYAVTVFEAQATAGGLLVNGIPGFKLDKPVVARRVDVLKRRGVVFQTQTKIGRDISFAELQKQFDAIFLGVGAQKAKLAEIPGENLRGVFAAIPFLIQYNTPGPFEGAGLDVRGKRVAVLGGGDTAMDCLRTAIRAGAADAVCVYRRDLANMPGSRKEYYNAIEEGARFEFLTNPVSIQGESAVTGVRCARMTLGEPDAQGRRKPVAIQGSEFVVEADVVLVAYGFDPEAAPKFSAAAPATDRWGALSIDKNQMTNLPGVFAGGDSSRGASLVVHAVRDGRAAARGIDLYLRGNPAGAKEGPLLATDVSPIPAVKSTLTI